MNRITVLIVGLLLMFGLFHFANKWMEARGNMERAEKNVKALKSDLEVYKNKKSQWQAKALAANGDINTLRISHQRELDSIEKSFGIKVKNLQNALTTAQQTNIEVDVTPDSVIRVKTDTIYSDVIFFHDYQKWYKIDGLASFDKVKIDLEVYDSISFATSWKRDKWFHRKTLYTEAISKNPDTKVVFLQSVNVKQSEPGRFSLGPYIGIGVGESLSPSVQVGIGLQYSLFRF